jgi:arsenate reductase (glutaredoxin)
VSEVTIYHNPNFGTSRNVLGLIRNAGIEPTIIEYLKAPPDRQTLLGLIKRMGIRVRDLLRRKGTPYDELGLDDPKWTDDQLIDAMLANPILINRPISRDTPWRKAMSSVRDSAGHAPGTTAWCLKPLVDGQTEDLGLLSRSMKRVSRLLTPLGRARPVEKKAAPFPEAAF